MKKSIFLSLFVFAGLALNAQCTKTAAACCANKKAQTSATSSTDTKVASYSLVAEAEAAAEKNDNIQKRVSEKDGSVSYYEKSVCEHSGSVTWNQVEYNSSEKKFTRVASASLERNTIPVDTKTTKACSAQDQKSCSKATNGKACCATKKAS